MPPKPKEVVKKTFPNVLRPSISNSSLMWIPADAVEGYQERIYRWVDWSLFGSTIRHRKEECTKEDLPPVSFTEAFQNKIDKSYLHGFFNEQSTLTLQEHWEILLPLIIWDNEYCNSEEKKICFEVKNNIIDNVFQILKATVSKNDRNILRKALKESLILRITDSKMTHLDEGLKEYEKLTTLNLCGNYLKGIDCECLPPGLRSLELQANGISSLDSFTNLPQLLLYLGLARNNLTNDGLQGICQYPRMLSVLDLSENDIYDLEPLLDVLVMLPNLTSLLLFGNPCSLCACYALTTISRLHRLRWLDNRQILKTDRASEPYDPHRDNLRSAYFQFTILKIMSPPVPPKPDKGSTATFHVELQLPLLDPVRRAFLMFRRCESLEELLPVAEDDPTSITSRESRNTGIASPVEPEAPSEETHIFAKLEPKNSLIIQNYTTFESNKVPWSKVMLFQEPTVRVFCPDLRALRDTFRSRITVKLIYTLNLPKKVDKKSLMQLKHSPTELHVTIATIKCTLRNPDWSQNFQHFHWDDSLGTDEAIHWGDGDLTAVQYQQMQIKGPKSKHDLDSKAEKQLIPENLTCQFGFGVETLHA